MKFPLHAVKKEVANDSVIYER